jgi:peptide/nickel transport system ATP-binding protein
MHFIIHNNETKGKGMSKVPHLDVMTAASPLPAEERPLLSVEGLQVEFATSRGVVRAVDGVSWSVQPGETLALVGESGCGKSVSALAVMRLLAKPAGRIVGGRILFEGQDLLGLSEDEMRERRGRDIAMIFQEPMTSLNPVLTIGMQLAEPLKIHLGMTDEQARARSIELLEMVGIADAERRLNQHPHHFSGGMRQRVMIAIGLACNPRLIIADEPTTALDVVVQRGVLQMLKDIQAQSKNTVLLVTHDLAVHANVADRVAIMYAGRIVEEAPTQTIFNAPRHPYTQHLIHSLPVIGDRSDKVSLGGAPPNLADPPSGCRFHPRCPLAMDRCRTETPKMLTLPNNHRVACHLVEEIAA